MGALGGHGVGGFGVIEGRNVTLCTEGAGGTAENGAVGVAGARMVGLGGVLMAGEAGDAAVGERVGRRHGHGGQHIDRM